MKGSPDLNIMEVNSKYNGFFIEFKSPTCKGVLSPSQKLNLERLKLRDYHCYLSDDYDEIIKQINNYMMTRRIKCQFCKKKFKNEITLNNHKKYFHKIKWLKQMIIYNINTRMVEIYKKIEGFEIYSVSDLGH